MSLPAMQVHLRVDYGKRCILRDVQFELRSGEALGMVGSVAIRHTDTDALISLSERCGSSKLHPGKK